MYNNFVFMKLKNISFCVLIASLILYNHSNASVNEEMKHNISYITENNTSTDLFLQQNNNPNNIISIMNVNLNKDNINGIKYK